MKQAVVTGADGFIGRYLIHDLLEHGVEVYAIIRKDSLFMNELSKKEGLHIVRTDLNRLTELPQNPIKGEPEVFYHLAWEGSTGSQRGDYRIQLANVNMAMECVEFAARIGCKRFIGTGSLAEKDCEGYIPSDGSHPNLVSIYGSSKIMAHFFTKAKCAQVNIEHIWARLANIYGEGNRTGNFISFAAGRFLRGERASFTEGEQWYDFLYASDAAQALRLLGENGKAFHSYFVGSGEPRKLKDFIFELRDAISPDIPVYLGEVPYQGESLNKEEYNCRKLEEDTGYRALVPFTEGIKKTIDWMKKGSL